MLKKALIAVAVVAVAAPGFALAKGKKSSDEAVQGPSSPIPYSQLAEEDAKLNGTGGGAKHHAKKKAAKPAADAGAAAPAK
jgi:hypothetical protein